jgi:predicted nucleic acid-binding protein
MADSYLIDSNILLRISRRDDPYYGIVAVLLERLLNNVDTSLYTRSASVYEKWRQLVREYRVRGVQVHDARLVATMLVHRIPNLITLNVTDFARYAEIVTPVHPGSLIA